MKLRDRPSPWNILKLTNRLMKINGLKMKESYTSYHLLAILRSFSSKLSSQLLPKTSKIQLDLLPKSCGRDGGKNSWKLPETPGSADDGTGPMVRSKFSEKTQGFGWCKNAKTPVKNRINYPSLNWWVGFTGVLVAIGPVSRLYTPT